MYKNVLAFLVLLKEAQVLFSRVPGPFGAPSGIIWKNGEIMHKSLHPFMSSDTIGNQTAPKVRESIHVFFSPPKVLCNVETTSITG